MKRSRTCQCLMELDTSKRTRSTPDLGALRRRHDVLGSRQQHSAMAAGLERDATLQLLRRSDSPPGMFTLRAPLADVDSAAMRSGGSVNKITIFEHEQFTGRGIGEERDYGTAAAASIGGGGGAGEPPCSSVLLDGTVLGRLFEDSGDPSDYFCGVASSDEAGEEGGECQATVGLSVLGESGSNDEEDNDDDTGSLRQASNASSGASAGEDDALGVVVDGAPPLPLPSWRCPSWARVAVSVMPSPPTGAGGGRGIDAAVLPSMPAQHADSKQQQRPTVISPPWPAVAPAGGWRGQPLPPLACAARSCAASGVYVVPEGRRHLQERVDDDGEGPLVPAVEDVKIMMDLDRLRLVDHQPKSMVVSGVGPEPMWTCRGLPLGVGRRGDSALQQNPRRGLA